MRRVKSLVLSVLWISFILWGIKYASESLRIKGYGGLLLESMIQDDTEFAQDYTDKRFLMIVPGMTDSQVLDIMGEPLSKWNLNDSLTRFSYSKSPSFNHYQIRQIHFKNRVVVKCHSQFYID